MNINKYFPIIASITAITLLFSTSTVIAASHTPEYKQGFKEGKRDGLTGGVYHHKTAEGSGNDFFMAILTDG